MYSEMRYTKVESINAKYKFQHFSKSPMISTIFVS